MQRLWVSPSPRGKILFFGGFLKKGTRDLLRYLIRLGKFSAWKERVSYQFKKDEKINCLFYFKNYVRNRLRMELVHVNVGTI